LSFLVSAVTCDEVCDEVVTTPLASSSDSPLGLTFGRSVRRHFFMPSSHRRKARRRRHHHPRDGQQDDDDEHKRADDGRGARQRAECRARSARAKRTAPAHPRQARSVSRPARSGRSSGPSKARLRPLGTQQTEHMCRFRLPGCQ
jgi:hypothetical protein